MRKSILALLVAASCLPLLLVTVEAYDRDYPIVAWSGSTPNIDGAITSGEWDDASTTQFNYTLVYVKQDGVNLYIAFHVNDNTENKDLDIVSIAIDVLNDGGSEAQPDDIFFYMLRNGTLYESNGTSPVSPPMGSWSGSVSSTSIYWQAEFNVTYAKVQITAGVSKILGIALTSIDGFQPYWWPPTDFVLISRPYNWGDLISGEAWIPEFPSFLILPLFINVTLLAVIIHRRRGIGIG